jgi:hypothetical protein
VSESTETTDGRRFSTGNESLDRLLGGGMPVGDLLALVAPRAGQSELLLRELASIRPTCYVDTSGAPAAEVRRRLDGADAEVVAPDPETLLADPTTVTERIRPESFVLVDATNPLEAADREAYRGLLNALKARVRETDSVAVLHCLDGPSPPAARTTTLHRADGVWQLEVTYGKREIGYQLLVSKSRFGRALDEPIPLVLTDRIRIDTSWSI